MAIKNVCKKIILIIITISILLSFMATPVSNAKLGLQEGEFYYSGTTKGTYVVTEGIFAWLIDNLGMIADWFFGLSTMGVRMAFVGWTALIEKLLTWSVEQAGGISNNGGLVVDSSDITSLSDSSGNLTVQAIVYNQVPLFDINFFNLETDKTVSPTGQILRCETCKKPCEECCNITKDTIPSGDKAPCTCDCSKTPCSNCKKYLENWKAEDPLVIKIREFVAMWYTIMRVLSLIAMLIALIGIGIKMALSTIASEKAVYKRMFVSWVGGMIILFSMHYLIYFIITMNEILVDTVKETANSINKTQIQFVNSGEKAKDKDGKDVQVVSDDEIEINIYEEIRTRAYDAKLSVGLTGMIMYMALVYFSIRYSIAYLKRYLTVIVLALMAPPLGVSYALQIALTGKASSLKTWMTEFVMTVIIQIVHALIYAVFISTALALSMESVAGMVVALIFMNFALKAEKLFRQIFKMGESDSLAGSAAEAGSAEEIQSKFKAVTGLAMSAKPVAGMMMNTPMAKGIKAAGKVGLAGAAGLIAAPGAIAGAVKRKKHNKEEENTERTSTTQETSQDGSVELAIPTMADEKFDQSLIKEGGESLRLKAANAVGVLKDDPDNKEAIEDIDNYVRYQNIMHDGKGKEGKKPLDGLPTSGQIIGAHLKKAVNITNHYKVAAPSKGGFTGNLSQGFHAVFGTRHYDPKTGKMVYDGNGYFSQFNSENLLGLSKEDKNFLKTEAMKPLIGVAGAIGMFGGLMVGVGSPGMGAAAFALGAHKYNQGFRQPAGSKAYKGKYGKAKFPAATMQTAEQQILKQAYKEIEANEKMLNKTMLKELKDNHEDLYNAIKNDLKEGGNYSGIKLSGHPNIKGFGKTVGNGIKNGASAATFVPKKLARATGLFNSAAFNDSMDKIDRYALVRARKETEAFEKECANSIKGAHKQEMEELIRQQDNKLMMELLEEHGGEEAYKKECEALGYVYDSKNHKLKKKSIDREDFEENVKAADAKKVEQTIDEVIQDMYKISGKVDSSDAGVERALQLINERLKNEGLIGRKQSIEDLFTSNDRAKKIVEDKTKEFDKQTKAFEESSELKDKLANILKDEKDKNIIEQIVLEFGAKNLDTNKVLDKISELKDKKEKQEIALMLGVDENSKEAEKAFNMRKKEEEKRQKEIAKTKSKADLKKEKIRRTKIKINR